MTDETVKTLPVVEGGPYSQCSKRQRLFVDEYLASNTAKDAYLRAGFKGKDPTDGAWALLKRPLISDAVIERRRQLLDDVGIRQERVVTELYAIATSDVRRLVSPDGETIPLHELDAKTAAAISSVEIEEVSKEGYTGRRYKYRFWDKTKALDKLGTWMKLWESSHSVNIDNRRVEINNSSPDARSEATLRAIDELIGTIRALGENQAAPASHSNRSVLSVAVRDAPQGHGTSVADGEDQGGSESS